LISSFGSPFAALLLVRADTGGARQHRRGARGIDIDSFRLFDKNVTANTEQPCVSCRSESRNLKPEGEAMAPKLALIFSIVIVIAAFVAINSWAAVPKHEWAAPTAAKATIYRADLRSVY
jgi:hypothetical protein